MLAGRYVLRVVNCIAKSSGKPSVFLRSKPPRMLSKPLSHEKTVRLKRIAQKASRVKCAILVATQYICPLPLHSVHQLHFSYRMLNSAVNSSAQLKCSTQVLSSTAQLNWSSVQGSFLGRDDARQPGRHAWGPVGRGRSKARADMGPQQQRALSFAVLRRSCCSRDPRRRRAESADDKPSEMGTRGSMTRRRR